MKKKLLFGVLSFSLLFFGFVLGFFTYGKGLSSVKKERPNPIALLDNNPSSCTTNHSFVVLITAYNVLPWCEQTLRSVFEQNYLNYRVVYIDDHSNDGSYEKVKDLVEKNCWKDRIVLVRNDKRKGVCSNTYSGIHQYCKDDDIVICLEGDDRLANPEVLFRLNQVYSNPSIWMSYSDYIEYPSFRTGFSGALNQDLLQRGEIRKHDWIFSQLKTFYAGLFKKIKMEDFVFQGDFVHMRWDLIAMFGMFEMARTHFAYIPEVLLIHTCSNPLNHVKVNISLYITENNYARSLPPYPPLIAKKLPFEKEKKSYKGLEIVIFSLDRCMQLYACLESFQKYAKGDVHTTVIYVSTKEKFNLGYEELKEKFPQVTFVRQPVTSKGDFKNTLLKVLYEETNNQEYVLFGVDSSLLKDYVDFSHAISMMEKTHGYCFFLCLGNEDHLKKSQKLIDLWDETYAWPLFWADSIWSLPHNLELTIYRKKEIKKMLYELNYQNPNMLRTIWGIKPVDDQRALALCYHQSKSLHMSGVHNHMFLSNEEYQDKFSQGLKIDISPFHQVKNDSHHIEYEIGFVPREENLKIAQ